jgi:hypothetical protein
MSTSTCKIGLGGILRKKHILKNIIKFFKKYFLMLGYAKSLKVLLGGKKDEYFNLKNNFGMNNKNRTWSEMTCWGKFGEGGFIMSQALKKIVNKWRGQKVWWNWGRSRIFYLHGNNFQSYYNFSCLLH